MRVRLTEREGAEVIRSEFDCSVQFAGCLVLKGVKNVHCCPTVLDAVQLREQRQDGGGGRRVSGA